jgi:acyl-CoA synthetase (AMP-forming)/AMP-acid ligase II
VLHRSSKTIKFSHYTISIFNTHGDFSNELINKNLISLMPPAQIGGLLCFVLFPLDLSTVLILLPVDAPLPMTAEYMNKIHRSIPDVDGGVYVPAVLKDLVRNPKYLNNMKDIEMIFFGGAPLDKETGDVLTNFATIVPFIGSTETGAYGSNVTEDSKDWAMVPL